MIRIDLKLPFGYTKDDMIEAIVSKLPVGRDEVGEIKIIKRRLDVGGGRGFSYDMSLGISFSPEREAGLLKMRKKVFPYEDMRFDPPKYKGTARPVVIGSGPAGLFAALALAEGGAKPVIFERGLSVEERMKKVKLFENLGVLDPECNVQYGEGGAGTYSDGKLKVGGMDKYKHKVLCEFAEHGAPEDIIYSVGAHLGTDKLAMIIKKLREKIVALGGEVHFSSRLDSINVRDGKVCGGTVKKDGKTLDFETDRLIVATGHSAKDVFEIIRDLGVPLEPRGFGIGMRIEHPREYVDKLVYGEGAPDGIGAASYHLVTHLKNGRSAYSFCMCPGGAVVAAASEECGIVTNGMSEYARAADNSNAAFLVSVTPEDFASDDPLAGVELQRAIERRAFACTGGNYKAPATTLSAFLDGRLPSSFGSVSPSYARGVETVMPEEYLPSFVTDSLKAAIGDFDDWMRGFNYPDAVMSGPETRTTSPVRVLRNSSFEAISIEGLYPCGEGAGYAGGIVSSARDGLMIAEKILEISSK